MINAAKESNHVLKGIVGISLSGTWELDSKPEGGQSVSHGHTPAAKG